MNSVEKSELMNAVASGASGSSKSQIGLILIVAVAGVILFLMLPRILPSISAVPGNIVAGVGQGITSLGQGVGNTIGATGAGAGHALETIGTGAGLGVGGFFSNAAEGISDAIGNLNPFQGIKVPWKKK